VPVKAWIGVWLTETGKEMKSITFAGLLPLVALPLLGGCINDAASLHIDGKDHSLSVMREQKWPWEKRVELFVVVSRMPDCQRRHHLKSSSIGSSTVEVFSSGADSFHLQQGDRLYFVETNTCEGFRELAEPPTTGLGQKMGTFTESAGEFRFVDEPAAKAVGANIEAGPLR
jgi:hypothetical protein